MVKSFVNQNFETLIDIFFIYDCLFSELKVQNFVFYPHLKIDNFLEYF